MTRSAPWLLGLLLVAIAACGSDDSADAAVADDTVEATTELMIPGEPSAADDADRPRTLPRDQTLELQANHPNGTVLAVDAVAFADDHIALDITVTNGHRQEIALNRFTHRRTRLRDNTGATYNLSPPPQNPEVRVEPGTTVEARLVFLGRVSPDARSLTLTTNHELGGDNAHSNNPTIVIANIPVERP